MVCTTSQTAAAASSSSTTSQQAASSSRSSIRSKESTVEEAAAEQQRNQHRMAPETPILTSTSEVAAIAASPKGGRVGEVEASPNTKHEPRGSRCTPIFLLSLAPLACSLVGSSVRNPFMGAPAQMRMRSTAPSAGLEGGREHSTLATCARRSLRARPGLGWNAAAESGVPRGACNSKWKREHPGSIEES